MNQVERARQLQALAKDLRMQSEKLLKRSETLRSLKGAAPSSSGKEVSDIWDSLFMFQSKMLEYKGTD